LKIITTGQGGAVLTDDDEVARKIRCFKDFGRDKGGIDVHASMGYNFKFTDLQAVIGIEQMKKLPARLARKKEIFRRYREELQGVVEFVPTDLNEVAPWFIDVYLDDRDQLATALRDSGIKTRAVYPPDHAQPAYAMPSSFPATESASERGLWLPSSVTLTDDEIHQISSQIRCFLRSK
jgi:perosamine synthetase